MSWPFTLAAVLTVVAAGAAMALRNLVHCALCLAVALAGLAVLFLQLNAQFVGFAQILVYVGAVAILIVFAILLTRAAEAGPAGGWNPSMLGGLAIAALVWFCLRMAILGSPALARAAGKLPAPALEPAFAASTPTAVAPVRDIGAKLMHEYVLPLEVVGLLLTAALLGAVIIAMQDRPETPGPKLKTPSDR